MHASRTATVRRSHPDIFRVEDDLSVVVGEGPDELMLAAAEACPTNAIRLVERETRRHLYP